MKMKYPKIGWHRWPTIDNLLLSIYEFIMYLLVICFVAYLYLKIQEVPLHSDEIFIYELSYGKDRINPRDSSIRFLHADIELRLPMTNVLFEEDKLKYGLTVTPTLKNKHKNDTIFVAKSNSFIPRSELFQLKNELQGLKGYYNQNDISWFYIKIKQKHTLFNQPIQFKKTLSWQEENGYYFKNSFDDNVKIEHLFLPDSVGVHFAGTSSYHHLVTPHILSLYDISQSYYNINLNGDFDRGQLIIDCTGATDFSEMYPHPDRITMSSIFFYDEKKIRIIKSNGLHFHAEFKELKNRQNARVFVLSAVLSALIAIFVTFLIMAIYKISVEIKLKKKK